MRNQVSL